MAKEQLDTVYRIVDVVGVSEKSWEDEGRDGAEHLAYQLGRRRVVSEGAGIVCCDEVDASFAQLGPPPVIAITSNPASDAH